MPNRKEESDQMFVILEGVDRTGKTTLAAKLKASWDAETSIRHHGPPTAHPLIEYVHDYLSYDPRAGRHIIADRHYLGELVWPQIFGRESELNEKVQRRIESFLCERGAVLVLCTRDRGHLLVELDIADEPVTGDRALLAMDAFETHFVESPLPHIAYDFEDPETPGLGDITRLAEAAQERAVAIPA